MKTIPFARTLLPGPWGGGNYHMHRYGMYHFWVVFFGKKINCMVSPKKNSSFGIFNLTKIHAFCVTILEYIFEWPVNFEITHSVLKL